VRERFSSARLRRRLLWLGGLAAVGAAVTGVIFAFPSPKTPPEARLSTEKADTVATPKSTPFAPNRKQVVHTAMEFVRTAISRKDIAASWDLAAPSLKQGYTKERWASGQDLPVPEYKPALAITRLAYSFKNEIDLQVALFASKTQKRPAVFDITLDRYRQGGQSRWLVSSFLPTPANGGGIGSGPNRANIFGYPSPPTAQSGRIWLLAPIGLFTLLLIVLGALGVRGWHAGRVYRAYARQD
jgi:hypothetical protein